MSKVFGSEYFTKEWNPEDPAHLFVENVEIETFDALGNRIAVSKLYPKAYVKLTQKEGQ